MLQKKLVLLSLFLLLKAGRALAQSQPAPPVPDPGYQQVSVPVPRAVSLLADAARVLFSRNEGQDKVQALIDRRKERSKKGEQTVNIAVPKNAFTRTLGLVE